MPVTTHHPKRRFHGDFESQIAGIPCKIKVTHFTKVEGSFSHSAASDLDYLGYEEAEFDVLDRKGYRAAWLERKMSDQDQARIEGEISEHMSTNNH